MQYLDKRISEGSFDHSGWTDPANAHIIEERLLQAERDFERTTSIPGKSGLPDRSVAVEAAHMSKSSAGVFLKWEDICFDVADKHNTESKGQQKRILHNIFGSAAP